MGLQLTEDVLVKRRPLCDVVECVRDLAGTKSTIICPPNTMINHPAGHRAESIRGKVNSSERVSVFPGGLKLKLACA